MNLYLIEIMALDLNSQYAVHNHRIDVSILNSFVGAQLLLWFGLGSLNFL